MAKKFTTTIQARSMHTMFVSAINREELPAAITNIAEYRKFYKVQNYDAAGVVFMYMGKGNPAAPSEVVVWYPNGKMWAGFGLTLETAIDGAQQDGWLYCK